MQSHRTLLGVLSMSIFLLAACEGSDSPSTRADAGPADEFALIERLATKACMCRLAGRDSSGVDRAFKAATASLEVAEGTETPAQPVHASRTCYPKFGPKACLVNLWVHKPYGNGAVCSYAQAEELMAAAKTAYRANPGNNDVGSAAVRKKFAEMSAAAAKDVPRSACN